MVMLEGANGDAMAYAPPWWARPSVAAWLAPAPSAAMRQEVCIDSEAAEVAPALEVRSPFWAKPSAGTWMLPITPAHAKALGDATAIPPTHESDSSECLPILSVRSAGSPTFSVGATCIEGRPSALENMPESLATPTPSCSFRVGTSASCSESLTVPLLTRDLGIELAWKSQTVTASNALTESWADASTMVPSFSTQSFRTLSQSTPMVAFGYMAPAVEKTPSAKDPFGMIHDAFVAAPTDSDLTRSASLISERRANFISINCEIHKMIFVHLQGLEAAGLSAVSLHFENIMSDDSLWSEYLRRELPAQSKWLLSSCGARPMARQAACAAYRALAAHSACRGLRWHRVPCVHALGAREGSPGMFCCNGYVFVYGGWGSRGPVNDLHAGPLKHPLVLRRLEMTGARPPPSYEMKVTLLQSADAGDSDVALFAVTGGYLRGGYQQESNYYAIIEIRFPGEEAAEATASSRSSAEAKAVKDASGKRHVVPDDHGLNTTSLPTARCVRCGEVPTPRSNHSATFVPSGAAGSEHPEGYLLLFGGIVRGLAVNCFDIFDLGSKTWDLSKRSSGTPPPPRNSHSATLLSTAQGNRIVVIGGGTGDSSKGAPPRGGRDLTDVYWLDPINLHWERGSNVAETPVAFFPRSHGMWDHALPGGRGHIAYPYAGGGVLAVAGGRTSTFTASFVTADSRGVRDVEILPGGADLPASRGFGGGCALPDGTLLLYGGWHAQRGNFSDFWAGHVDGWPTPFCSPLCPPALQPPQQRKRLCAAQRRRRASRAAEARRCCYAATAAS